MYYYENNINYFLNLFVLSITCSKSCLSHHSNCWRTASWIIITTMMIKIIMFFNYQYTSYIFIFCIYNRYAINDCQFTLLGIFWVFYFLLHNSYLMTKLFVGVYTFSIYLYMSFPSAACVQSFVIYNACCYCRCCFCFLFSCII